MHSSLKRLSLTVHECKRHIIRCPKHRSRVMDGEVRFYVRDVIRHLCKWKPLTIIQGNVWKDDVHLVLETTESERELCCRFLERRERDKDVRLGRAFPVDRLFRKHSRSGDEEQVVIWIVRLWVIVYSLTLGHSINNPPFPSLLRCRAPRNDEGATIVFTRHSFVRTGSIPFSAFRFALSSHKAVCLTILLYLQHYEFVQEQPSRSFENHTPQLDRNQFRRA